MRRKAEDLHRECLGLGIEVGGMPHHGKYPRKQDMVLAILSLQRQQADQTSTDSSQDNTATEIPVSRTFASWPY